jgi:hypothetical protein
MFIAGTISAATVKPYRVPKQKEPVPQTPATAPEPPKETVNWTVPAGWEEVPPGEMRLGSFKIKGADGKQADVSIIPLPGMAGSDLENVNRWRSQVGLTTAKEAELARLAEKVQISGEAAQLYDLAGQPPGSKIHARILAAIQRRQGVVFFYKMTGEDKLVAAQKPAFVAFLKSVRFEPRKEGDVALPASHPPIGGQPAMPTNGQSALPPSHPPIGGVPGGAEGASPVLPASHPPIANAGAQAGGSQSGLPPSHPPIGGMSAQAGAASSTPHPNWKVPPAWQEQAAGPMQMARFLATGKDDTKAEASVVVIPGDGGGPLANVNRWRQQLGLAAIEPANLAKETSTLEVGAVKALVMDATSSDLKKRLVAISVPREGGTWFYKLAGDAAVVAREKDAFLGFVQTAK